MNDKYKKIGFVFEKSIYNPFKDSFFTYINEDVELIWNDICRLHTELIDGTPGEHCVEIRPIQRKANAKGVHDIVIKNFHLWRADEDTKERFKKWINKDIKNKACCLYISVYNFDSSLKLFKNNGTTYRAYTINKYNQLYTRVMVIDLDHITEEENKVFNKIMDDIGVPFQSIKTSPHGFQKRFYLIDQVEDTFALSKFVKLLVNKGFKVDEKAINRGQIVRLLGSVNNKVFSPKFIDRTQQFKIKVERDSNKKIAFKELLDKINSLKNVKFPKYNDSDLINIKTVTTIMKGNFKPIAYYREEIFVKNYKNLIPEHYFNSFQKPIKFMLIDTPERYTDAVIMFIIPYLKNTLRLSFEQIKPIMDKWAKLNNYFEIDKYERIYYTKYTKRFGNYPIELRERYGSIIFNKNYDVIIKINDNTVNLKSVIFDKEFYSILDKTALKVFMGFLFEYKISEKINWTIKEVMRFNNISKPTVIKSLKILTKLKFIKCQLHFRGSGKENEYILLKTYIATKIERRLEFTLTQLREMSKSLKANEIKVFMYMKFIILKSLNKKYFGNQIDIAKHVGMSQQMVSEILMALNKKMLINIEKIKIKGNNEFNTYTLLV